MRGDVARQAFQHLRVVEQFRDLRAIFLQFAHFRDGLEALFQRDVQLIRNQLGDLVHFAVWNVENAPDVADDGLRAERPERRNLRDVFLAVFPRNVFDHLFAPIHAEIHVNIRHAHALWVQKPLEQQIVFDRVDVGDAHAERREAARGRTTPRTNGNTFAFRVMNEIPDNQEIPGVAHLFDNFQFDVEPLQIGGANPVMLGGGRVAENDGEPLFKAISRYFFHVGIERVAFRHLVFRQDVAAEFEGELTLFRDFQRVRQRVGIIGKHGGHLRR